MLWIPVRDLPWGNVSSADGLNVKGNDETIFWKILTEMKSGSNWAKGNMIIKASF